MIIKEIPVKYEVTLSAWEAHVIHEALREAKDANTNLSSDSLTLFAQFDAYLMLG